jgi:hypothetical protein
MPHNESQMIHPNQQLSGSALTLQLHFSLEVSTARLGLVSASPE